MVDIYHYHEALDRTHIVTNIVADYLGEHPVYEKHVNLKKKIDVISDELNSLYQEIGNLTDVIDQTPSN